VKAFFGPLVGGEVERFELPNLGALNFLLHGALGGAARCRCASMRRARRSERRCCGWKSKSMLKASREGKILRLVLDRPEKRNALNSALCTELAAAIEDAAQDAAVGAILLSGAGPSFCSGMDLSEMLTPEAFLARRRARAALHYRPGGLTVPDRRRRSRRGARRRDGPRRQCSHRRCLR